MRILLAACVFAMLLSGCAAQQSVGVSSDHKKFVLLPSSTEFKPWGFNYDRDYKMRLLEDYWATAWPTVEGDFREMKALGANVVRVHLQLAQFMETPDRANEANLDRLDRLCALAQQVGLYLDLTGCASYHKDKDPDWYAKANEHDRWQAQANFWSAIARTCAKSSAIFCYDLINEPAVPEAKQNDWLASPPLAGFYYVNFITTDPAGRDPLDIIDAWASQMIRAIRAQDQRHLITIGMLPITPNYARRLSNKLDFIAAHIYPDRKKVDAAIENLRQFDVGKPIVVEETFPMLCSIDEMAEFITKGKPVATGFISFYWGKSIDELKASQDVSDAIVLAWQQRFQTLKP